MIVKTVSSLLLFLSLGVWADAVSTDILFSDSYEGYLFNEKGWSWGDERVVTTYASPNKAAITEKKVELTLACLEGSGADCTLGVLYKKFSEDSEGNEFYLIKSQAQRDVWVLINGIEPRVLEEKLLTLGGELIFANNFEDSDTSQADGVPNLDAERKSQLNKLAQQFAPALGNVALVISGDTRYLSVKEPGMVPDGEFFNYSLSKDSYYFSSDSNEYNITSTVFKRQDNYLGVVLEAVPGLKEYSLGFDENVNYVWLDVSGLPVEVDEWTLEQSKDYLLSQYGGNFIVKEIRVFNGHRYGLVVEVFNVSNPFLIPDENNVESSYLSVPYRWIKIRDDKQRLRFWFGLTVSC